MIKYILVGAGGFLGAISRFALSGLVNRVAGTRFPLGTLTVNVTGSFVLAFLMSFLMERALAGPQARLFWAVGFLGAFTTFSTFAYETDILVREGSFMIAALNILANVIAALAAVRTAIYLQRILT
jgi:CrcB protein